MVLSLRDVAERCLGVTGTLSVNTDVFGYIFRDDNKKMFGQLGPGDALPGTGTATGRSLLRHLQTINGSAFDMVPILVNHENDFSGRFSLDDATKVQYAIQVARDIYAQQDVGIRGLNWQRIPKADADGYTFIRDQAEAADLTDDWSGPEGGIDVFFVQNIGDAAGWSNRNGPCNKNSIFGMTGAVLEVSGARLFTGVVVAHEVGHYLGLGTGPSPTNVMGSTATATGSTRYPATAPG